jgi:hypothetical protein
MSGSSRNALVAGSVCVALGAVGAPAAEGAAYRVCKPVIDPYPGTRYEGSDLRRIRALNVSCRTARRVAKGAHYKALGIPPPASGIRRFTWSGWKVTGDLRGGSDRYVAKKGENRVRWRF